MQQVIIWAAVLGVSAFALGLVSAIGSRRLRKEASLYHRTIIVREEQLSNRKAVDPKNKKHPTAMSAAAGSDTKEKEQLAQIGSYPS